MKNAYRLLNIRLALAAIGIHKLSVFKHDDRTSKSIHFYRSLAKWDEKTLEQTWREKWNEKQNEKDIDEHS